MAREQGACLQTHLEVVHAEVGGVGVGYIDSHQRNIGLLEDVSNPRGHVFLDLELDRQIHAPGDELFRVLDRNIGIVAIVEGEQFDA